MTKRILTDEQDGLPSLLPRREPQNIPGPVRRKDLRLPVVWEDGPVTGLTLATTPFGTFIISQYDGPKWCWIVRGLRDTNDTDFFSLQDAKADAEREIQRRVQELLGQLVDKDTNNKVM